MMNDSATSIHEPSRAASSRNLSGKYLEAVSIVVPVGPGDSSWRNLVADLAVVSRQCEIWFVGVEPLPDDFHHLLDEHGVSCTANWIVSAPGRARQMNLGASRSTQSTLWFLHADSRVARDSILVLDDKLRADPDAIYFFDLRFDPNSPSLSRCNEWGVWLRSRWLKLPFGDQGLCLGREQFERLGGFCEDATYGEDHLLVWQAHRQRVPVRPVGAPLLTSARKYRQRGWLRVTLLHLYRTCRQALPQLVRTLWSRCR